MVAFIVQLIVILLVCGFVYWVWTLVRPLLSFMPAVIMQMIDILVIVLLVAIVLFYAIIPLIRMIPKIIGI
jgi:hypothetical protein